MKIFFIFSILTTCFNALSKERDFIIVDHDIAIKKAKDKAAPNNNKLKWKDGVVPWEISPKDKDADQLTESVTKALKFLSDKTNLVFRKRTAADNDYVSFTSEYDGCFSYVGRQGGRQEINLSKGCRSMMTVAHEILHAVGLEHEQSREDREKYINIIWENINKKNQHNFNKVKGSRYGEYNFESIMHYGSYSFSKNGKPTIITKDGETFQQNREYLSEGDINGVNFLYPREVKEFLLEDVKLKKLKLKEKNFILSLKSFPGNLKHVASVQYLFDNSELDSPLLENWEDIYKYVVKPPLGENLVTVEFNLKNGKKMEKSFSFYNFDKRVQTVCTFSVKRDSKKFTVPLVFSEKEAKVYKVPLENYISEIQLYFDVESKNIILSLQLIREKGLIRKEKRTSKKFLVVESSQAQILLKKAKIGCNVLLIEDKENRSQE
jgi:hypothetical protein